MTVAEQAAEGTTQKAVHTRALIIGTGFSGLGMAIALQKQGVDFLILEKADEVGGTWRDNTYPGCACDVPSHLYSFSFEPKADWSKLFSPQPEILRLPQGRHRQVRAAPLHQLRLARRPRALGRRRVPLARVHHRRAGVRRPVPDLRGGRAAHSAASPTSRVSDEFRGRRFPFRAVGPRRRPHRQAGGGDRNRRQRHPDRAGDRQRTSRELQLYQRTPPWVVPRPNKPFPTPCEERVHPRARAAARQCAPASTGSSRDSGSR